MVQVEPLDEERGPAHPRAGEVRFHGDRRGAEDVERGSNVLREGGPSPGGATSKGVHNGGAAQLPALEAPPNALRPSVFGDKGAQKAQRGRPRATTGVLRAVCLVLFASHVFQQMSHRAIDVAEADHTNQQIVSNSLGAYHVLCTAPKKMLGYNSFRVRCKELAHHISTFAPNIVFEVASRSSPTIPSKYFNATISVKGLIPAATKNHGHVIIDLVDSGVSVASDAFIIVLSEADPRYNTDTAFVIEHACQPVTWEVNARNRQHGRTSKKEVAALILWFIELLPLTKAQFKKSYGDLNLPGVKIYHLFRSEDRLQEDLKALGKAFNVGSQLAQYGRPGMFAHLHQQFDVILVFSKREKGQGKSVQRIINAMASGVLTFVEYHGETFITFLKKYGYTCVFHSRNELASMLRKLTTMTRTYKEDELLDTCRRQANLITAQFSPRNIVLQYVQMFEKVENLTGAP